MTIVKARELLGKEGEKLSDEEVLKTIETARLLADIFFDQVFTKPEGDQTNDKAGFLPKSN